MGGLRWERYQSPDRSRRGLTHHPVRPRSMKQQFASAVRRRVVEEQYDRYPTLLGLVTNERRVAILMCDEKVPGPVVKELRLFAE